MVITESPPVVETEPLMGKTTTQWIRGLISNKAFYLRRNAVAKHFGVSTVTLWKWSTWLWNINETFRSDWEDRKPLNLFQAYLLSNLWEFWSQCPGLPDKDFKAILERNFRNITLEQFQQEFNLK